MHRFKTLFLALLLTTTAATATGCAHYDVTPSMTISEKASETDRQVLETIALHLSLQDSDFMMENMTVLWAETIPAGQAVGVTFEQEGHPWEAIGEIGTGNDGQPKILTLQYTPTDEKTVFTTHASYSSIEQGKWYSHIGGLVHDPAIKTLRIAYEDGMVADVEVRNNAYYHIRKGSAAAWQATTALDGEGRVLYTNPPHPPKKVE